MRVMKCYVTGVMMASTLLWLPALRSVRFGPARTGQEQSCRVGGGGGGGGGVSLTQYDAAPALACIDGQAHRGRRGTRSS